MTRYSRIIVALVIVLSGVALIPQVSLFAGVVSWQRYADGYGDVVTVSRARYRNNELEVRARSSAGGAPTLTVYRTSDNALIGTLAFNGSEYRGEFNVSNARVITVRSSLGGWSTVLTWDDSSPPLTATPSVTTTPAGPGATNTPVPPAPTNTPVSSPTTTGKPTNTPAPPAPTNTAVVPTATRTPVPPTNTATRTAVPPTATRTPTRTVVPPTATRTPTRTAVPPTATRTPTRTAPPWGTYTGTLSGTGQSQYRPDSYYEVTTSGTHTGSLTGPSNANFNLYLEKLSGSRWATVASSLGQTSTESIRYSGTSGRYRWRIYSNSGSGNYTLVTTRPN